MLNPMRDRKLKARTGGEKGRYLRPQLVRKLERKSDTHTGVLPYCCAYATSELPCAVLLLCHTTAVLHFCATLLYYTTGLLYDCCTTCAVLSCAELDLDDNVCRDWHCPGSVTASRPHVPPCPLPSFNNPCRSKRRYSESD